jgi:hypothetical protein
MSYDLSAEELSAGQTLNVSLSWSNLNDPLTTTVTLVSPARHLSVGQDVAPILAKSAALVPTGGTTQTVHSLAIPSETPRGIYLIKVQAGTQMVYLRPVRIHNVTPIGDAPVLASFDDGRILLHHVRAEQVTPTQLAVTLDWSVTRAVEANYAIAVRLHGVTSIDTQPGYGFLPTSLWRPGELIADRYTLKLPEGMPPRNDYQVGVLLYDGATQAGAGDLYAQKNVALTLYSRRPADSPTLAHFGLEIALATLDVPARHEQGKPTLDINAGWLATAAQSTERIARWTIYDSDGMVVFTQTIDLVAGSPASLWPAGAYVVGQTPLNIPVGLAPGKYRLGVTVLNLSTRSEEGSYLAPSTFEIIGHPRTFTIVPMQHHTDVAFGQQIRLLGYDVQLPISNIKPQTTLTLYWQAAVAPRDDYKVFVHLFNPADERIATQHDAMPLDGRYPTSWWAAGEVVSETVTLNLKDVKPGVYRLAVGLYEPDTVTRLAAVGPDGARLEADRLVLLENVTVPK